MQKLDGMSGLFNLDNPFDEIINILEKSVKSGHFLIQVARKNTLREAKNISPFLNLVEHVSLKQNKCLYYFEHYILF